ncbi:DUF4845 domain-containing protein [Pseudomonas sp. LTJR-52]|uniref:DUF4845 domain-containing protein n=1 Tax=Pseudomonas sp. LTJR-52 TaxID=2479392 RepID=UPI000EFD41D6|nr:DUF4845 domain-containing protein [Pseudomonas sp. LTJR-52]AYN95214.1 DUF4845 domain-containing protein [Pseudomonas sp. LTJR-52]
MSMSHRQKGLSFIGWLLMLCIIAFLASTAFKLIPHYLDYQAMTKVITSIESEKAINIHSVPDVYSYVSKGMQVNSINDIDLDKAMQVKTEDNRFLIHLNYEKREPLIRNIDLVVHFERDFRISIP